MKIRMKSAILEILDKNINLSQDKLGVEHKMVEWTKTRMELSEPQLCQAILSM